MNTVYCKDCKKNISKSNYARHCRSEGHKDNVYIQKCLEEEFQRQLEEDIERDYGRIELTRDMFNGNFK